MTNAVNLASVAGNGFYARNRIINGAMQIDQRNNGASVTQTTAGDLFAVDRWQIYGNITSKFSAQQNAGGVTPPAGFTNYLGITSLSSYSITSSDQFVVVQSIEGFNVSDLGWGASGALPVTVSFWVRSSLTGLFNCAILNIDYTRSYPFGFTINSANTWEQKTITIPGDTTGTWNKTNLSGLRLYFNMGTGSTFSGPANAWGAGAGIAIAGANSLVGTNGATFYFTGVQLEVGTVATPFERRLYPQELSMCQRYCEAIGDQTLANADQDVGIGGSNGSGSNFQAFISWKTTKRTAPTVTLASASSFYCHFPGQFRTACTSVAVGSSTTFGMHLNGVAIGSFTAPGQFCFVAPSVTGPIIIASAEL